jgi:hypothetical protein
VATTPVVGGDEDTVADSEPDPAAAERLDDELGGRCSAHRSGA